MKKIFQTKIGIKQNQNESACPASDSNASIAHTMLTNDDGRSYLEK